MKIQVINKSKHALPEYATGQSAGMDIRANLDEPIDKVSFTAEQIAQNAKEFISTINKLKPAAAKGTYIKSIYLSSTYYFFRYVWHEARKE